MFRTIICGYIINTTYYLLNLKADNIINYNNLKYYFYNLDLKLRF